MESTIHARIEQLIERKGLRPFAFSRYVGSNPSSISAILTGQSKPSYDLVEKIAAAFPDLSMEWLIKGAGPMLFSPISPTANDPTCWDLLKREEEQHKALRKDYDALKVELRKTRVSVVILANELDELRGDSPVA